MNDRISAIFRGVGTGVIVAAALARAVAVLDPMPVWNTDPRMMWVPPSGVGPSQLMMLDCLSMLAAAAVAWSLRDRVRLWPSVLCLIGLVGIVIHALLGSEHAEQGASWAAAIAGGFAIAHLPRGSASRALALAAVLAISMLLVARGIVQVFIEHPQTVASYELTRDSFLASHGWSPDSAMARNYERRLYQSDATGWFGLANVYGSEMAAGLAVSAIAAIGLVRKRIGDWRVPVVLGLAAIACAVGLALSHSKGAVGSAILGCFALALALKFPKRARLIVALVPVIVLLGVVARGFIGERISELSIYFRWFYMEGATRIFWHHPLLGVGPAGFKDAYLIAKPALSPEEVISPHSVLFDWLSALGLFGFGWIGVFALACRSIGARLDCDLPSDVPQWEERRVLVAAVAIIALAVAFSAWVEQALLTPSMGIARAGGLLAGFAVAAAVVRGKQRAMRVFEIAAAGSALVLLAHTQIEVSAVWAGSAPLLAARIGLGCNPPESRNGVRGPAALLGGGLVAVAGILLIAVLPTLMVWQGSLNRATADIRPISEAGATLREMPPESPEVRDAVLEIAGLVGAGPARDGAELQAQLTEGGVRAAEAALPELRRALEVRPHHIGTREALVRMLVSIAANRPEQRASLACEALEVAEAGADLDPDRSAAWGLLANAALATSPDDPGAIRLAYDASARAAELDPHGLNFPLRLVDLSQRLGREDLARAWAKRSLEIDRLMRLDPLKGLTKDQRERLESMVR